MGTRIILLSDMKFPQNPGLEIWLCMCLSFLDTHTIQNAYLDACIPVSQESKIMCITFHIIQSFQRKTQVCYLAF